MNVCGAAKDGADFPSWRPLRIGFAVGSLEIGGTERQTVRLACSLAERGHDVHVFALMRGGPLEQQLAACDVPFEVFGVERLIERSPSRAVDARGTARALERLGALVRSLRRRRLDVIQAALLWPTAICLSAGALARVPVRVSARRNLGTDLDGRHHPAIERVANAASHHIVANSEAVKLALLGLGAPPAKVVVIPNGVGLLLNATDVAAQPARGVVVANLIHYKGHRDLIEALSLLEDPPLVECIGDGPERVALARLLDETGLSGSVRFVGQVDDPSPHYRDAQFAVLPSHEEGLPNAVLEAMTAGLPVVATAVGGVPEIIRDGKTGVLVPPRDPRALAAAVARVATDPGLRIRLGQCARRDVIRRFGWDRCVEQYESLYLTALARTRDG